MSVPSALPSGKKIRALIWNRGYTISGVARQIGCPPASLYAITGRKVQDRRSVGFLRRLALFLSTPDDPVRVSDISDWAGYDGWDDEPGDDGRLSA